MSRPQFTIGALLVLLLAVACFFGGIQVERERQRRADEAAALAAHHAVSAVALVRYYQVTAELELQRKP